MRWFWGWTIVLLSAAVGRAELAPDEVGVIAMAESKESCRLAEYYAEVRGVPKSHVFLLRGKPGREMDRAVWEDQARPAIRDWLSGDGRHTRIRCLVTTWDVPLRIAKRPSDSPVVMARQDFLTRSRANLIDRFNELLVELDTVAREGQPSEPAPFDAEATPETLRARFASTLEAAQQRQRTLTSEDERKQAGAALERAFVMGGGINGLMNVVARAAGTDGMKPQAAQQVEFLRGRLEGLRAGLQALLALPDSVTRDMLLLKLIPMSDGLVGAIGWIDEQREELRKNETRAGFDSELSLVGWPDYPLLRWQPNPLHYRYDKMPDVKLATLMVSRLEAPTFELAKKLIDTAIATEKTGLAGKVYLDARGMKFDPKTDKPGSYGAYDQSLRDLAERLRKHTKLEVVLDDQAELFQEGDCPEAALYCGWYSLAKYVDAFDWQPGAVGYHLASSEATTVRTPGSKVWCNAMLEDGVCATMGPAFEPYLASFPLPDDFFSLLLTGRYTLAEAYYRTKPFNSWAMVLVGDPLYNPFKNDPPLGEDALPERMHEPPAEEPE